MTTYTLKWFDGYKYNLYNGSTAIPDADATTIFKSGTAGEAYFVFDFNGHTPSDTSRFDVRYFNNPSVTIVSRTGLGSGYIEEGRNYKGSWDGYNNALSYFAKVPVAILDESQMSDLMGKIKERPIVGATLSTPSNVAYVATANIQDGAVTAAKIATSTYSTTEQVIGTWIDGKPLYRKTVNCGAGPNNGIVYTSLNVTGARVHNLYGTGINSAGGALPVNSVRPVDGISSSIGAYYNGAQIAIESGTDRSGHTFYITVEYTKASDT